MLLQLHDIPSIEKVPLYLWIPEFGKFLPASDAWNKEIHTF